MRKITVLEFMTLDGVMQAPGGPEEDVSAQFEFGGWQAPYDDPVINGFVGPALQADVDFLLGGRTFEIWKNYWPTHGDFWPVINSNTKYVLSTTQTTTDWQNTSFMTNIDDIRKLKESDGKDLHVWGSSKVVQSLLANDMVDEMILMTYPVILGQGKTLFMNGAAPRAFTLTEGKVGDKGVIAARYVRAGTVETGTVGE